VDERLVTPKIERRGKELMAENRDWEGKP